MKNKKLNLPKGTVLFGNLIICILFAMPSFLYYMRNGTVFKFNKYFKFLLNNSDRVEQTAVYFIILLAMVILYLVIIKLRKQVFSSTKKMFLYITIIAIIFVAIIPFTCSDVFYYLGVGRIESKYGQNPYYTTIKEFVETGDNSKYLEQDTVLEQGYINDWSDSTVVYGPLWAFICKIVSTFSFGNIDIGLLVFKLLNVVIHLLNCYFIYKLTGKKIWVLLYGLNPFILIEGIACVHNDMFVILFTLLSFYFLLKRKNLLVSVAMLALATAIKYFTIILLPFIIIYHFREEKPLKRFGRCVQYGLWFVFILGICYLFYVRDLQVLSGLFIQQEKLAKNFYIIITEYFVQPEGLVTTVNKTLLRGFVIVYFFTMIILLNKKEIKFRKEIRKTNYFIMAFLFLLITNFQPWYIMWLFPCIMWQKTEDIKAIIGISLMSEFANMVFLLYSETWQNGTPFTFVFITGSLLIIIINDRLKRNRQIKCFKKGRKLWKINLI